MKPKNGKTNKAAPGTPDGYEEIGSNLAGWFIRKVGNQITGDLRGSFVSKGSGKFPPRKVYRVEITAGQTLVSTADDDSVSIDAGVVGVDETGYLKRLADLPDGRGVILRVLSKGPDEKDPWVWQLLSKKLPPPPF